MSIAECNGVQLYYRRSGAGEPLVLVHGSWVDCRVWDGVVPLLSRSFEVIAYDRRGHSRSACPPGQGSVRDDVDDLASLIEALELSPAHVAGASLGGSIALRLAAARPELLSSVTVHEPPLFDLLRARGPDMPELTELRAPPGHRRVQRLESGDPEGGARLYFDQVAADARRLGRPRSRAARPAPLQRSHLSRSMPRPRCAGHRPRGPGRLRGPGARHPRRPSGRRSSGASSRWSPAPWRGREAKRYPGRRTIPQVTHPGRYSQLIEDFVGTMSGSSMTGSAAAGARKEQALRLFAGLPRRYDAAGAVLSFGQDPRWRQGDGGPGRRPAAGSRARRRDRNRHGRGRPRAPLRLPGRGTRSESRDARAGGGEAARRAPSSRRASSSFAVRPSRCRSRTASSTT